ncbi:hypothetical protein [Actinacidiphila rubida]|uniref:Uncharacterized protein n=1 Tax=Actinacidiphila rubida TaxID=310780 RepID=A0A1H8DHQ7_9ACTN|nr:hypothetical protein [Actinacidiphila rubida]SEN06780.1 hypothetical protein SAMN05216267_1001116 [Actinacidiphila rubida]
MTSTTVPPGPTVHGGTAIGPREGHPRHRIGDALHALRVFAVTAVEIVILGADDKRY